MESLLTSVVLLQHGLVFNHAQEGYVMMTRWLPTSEPSMIPEYANQYLGNAHVNIWQEVRDWLIQGSHQFWHLLTFLW